MKRIVAVLVFVLAYWSAFTVLACCAMRSNHARPTWLMHWHKWTGESVIAIGQLAILFAENFAAAPRIYFWSVYTACCCITFRVECISLEQFVWYFARLSEDHNNVDGHRSHRRTTGVVSYKEPSLGRFVLISNVSDLVNREVKTKTVTLYSIVMHYRSNSTSFLRCYFLLLFCFQFLHYLSEFRNSFCWTSGS